MSELLGVVDMFIILIVEMASLVYTYLKIYQMLWFTYMQFNVFHL